MDELDFLPCPISSPAPWTSSTDSGPHRGEEGSRGRWMRDEETGGESISRLSPTRAAASRAVEKTKPHSVYREPGERVVLACGSWAHEWAKKTKHESYNSRGQPDHRATFIKHALKLPLYLYGVPTVPVYH